VEKLTINRNKNKKVLASILVAPVVVVGVPNSSTELLGGPSGKCGFTTL